jgi:hypothetical protein
LTGHKIDNALADAVGELAKPNDYKRCALDVVAHMNVVLGQVMKRQAAELLVKQQQEAEEALKLKEEHERQKLAPLLRTFKLKRSVLSRTPDGLSI